MDGNHVGAEHRASAPPWYQEAWGSGRNKGRNDGWMGKNEASLRSVDPGFGAERLGGG